MTYSVRPFNIASVAPPEGLNTLQMLHEASANVNTRVSVSAKDSTSTIDSTSVSVITRASDSAKLDLEIGCGVGWHPIIYARSHPERRLIAIEHTRAKFERFQSRLRAHPDITNLYAIHGDAIRWVTHLRELSAPKTLSRCFLLYPNPERKAENKRWLRMPFFSLLLSKLEDTGEIHLATNEEWYWQEALDWAEKAWGLKVAQSRSFTLESIGHKPRTHFEQKYLARGETCFDAIFRKA